MNLKYKSKSKLKVNSIFMVLMVVGTFVLENDANAMPRAAGMKSHSSETRGYGGKPEKKAAPEAQPLALVERPLTQVERAKVVHNILIQIADIDKQKKDLLESIQEMKKTLDGLDKDKKLIQNNVDLLKDYQDPDTLYHLEEFITSFANNEELKKKTQPNDLKDFLEEVNLFVVKQLPDIRPSKLDLWEDFKDVISKSIVDSVEYVVATNQPPAVAKVFEGEFYGKLKVAGYFKGN